MTAGNGATSVATRPRPAVAPAPPGERRRRRRVVRAPWWFLVPAAAFYGFVVLYPSARGVGLAFTDWDGLSNDRAFVGVEQFRRLLSDDAATGAIVNAVLIAVAVTVVQNVVGLLLALGVNTRIRSRHLLRVVLFAPAVITPVATAYLWRFMFSPEGPVNRLFDAVGLGGLRQDWLGDPDIALWSVVLVVIWQFSGYSMVIFLAGLQGVGQDVLEASRVDGAGPFRRFRHIVLPALAPAITINLMLSIIGGLKLFDQVWVMTGGGPGTSTETMSTLIYKNAFQFNDFAYGIAMAVVLTAFVAVLSAMQYGALSRQGGNR